MDTVITPALTPSRPARRPERLLVLRAWWEQDGEGAVLRVSLRDTVSDRRHHFAGTDALTRFLLAELGDPVPADGR